MSKLRLIQCGMGGMGTGWWRNVVAKSPDFDMVAVVDVVDKPLNESGETLGLPPERRFKSLEAALDSKVQADAILTVTPPAIHSQHAKIAFDHGLHVLTEKPLADTLENAQAMVQQAKKVGKQLVVGQNYRFTPPIQRLKAYLAEKPVGDFGHGQLDFYIGADFTGTFRETMDFPLLVDMAIHHMDLIRCVTGRNIRKVTALSFKPSWSWYKHDPGLKMLMEMDDGAAFSYSGDWSALGKQTPWNGNWRLQCAGGSIHLDDDRITLAKCEKWGKDQSFWPQNTPDIPLISQHKLLSDFAQAIRTGKPAETSGEDNLWSFGAVMAGVLSVKEGRTVDVKELIGR